MHATVSNFGSEEVTLKAWGYLLLFKRYVKTCTTRTYQVSYPCVLTLACLRIEERTPDTIMLLYGREQKSVPPFSSFSSSLHDSDSNEWHACTYFVCISKKHFEYE